MRTGIDDFFSVAKDLAKLSTLVAASSLFAPFIAAFGGVSPPWPAKVAAIAAVFQLITLVYIFQLNDRFSAKFAKRRVTIFLITFLSTLLVYMVLFSVLVIRTESGHQVISGFECTTKALVIYTSACPLLGAGPLADARYDEFALWTKWSITAARLALLACWVSMFSALSAFFAQFVIVQRRKPQTNQTKLRFPFPRK